MKSILIIGGGGHAKSCIDVIVHDKEFSISGINDPKISTSPFQDIPLIEGSLEELFADYKIVFLGIGFIKNSSSRKNLIKKIQQIGFSTPSFISPFAYSSIDSKIGEGTIIMHQALINTHVYIGSFSIINSQALIEHDVQIGSNCHISTGAVVNGSTTIGSNTFIGSNAVIGNNLTIGDNCIIQAGSFLNRSLDSNETFKA